MKKCFLILVVFVVFLVSGVENFAQNNNTLEDELTLSVYNDMDLEKVKLCIQQGADVDDFLYLACKNGNVEIVKFLLENSADPNGLAHDYDDGVVCSPLILSIWYRYDNYTDICKLLLEHGANPNAHLEYFGSALYFTCANGNTELAKLLLEHGANPNSLGRHGMTAFCQACYSNDIELVKLFLKYGADPTLRDGMSGYIPLDIAVSENNIELIQILYYPTMERLIQK